MTQVTVPDFFIIGAPKCGTTALASFLAQHPEICFSSPKEPHYYLEDINLHIKMKSAEAYNRAFRCESGQLRGEGSVWYLYSSATIEKLNRLNPKSKMIVLVRDPIDLISSLHSHQVFQEFEDILNINDALAAERLRGNGNGIPKGCPDPYLLQYSDIARLGVRVQKVFDTVGADRVRVYFQNELSEQPDRVYLDALDFLGLEDDGYRMFTRRNTRKNYRKSIFYQVLFYRPAIVKELRDGLKRIFKIDDFLISRLLSPLATKKEHVPHRLVLKYP